MTGGSANDGDGTRAELSERDWKNQVLQRAMARIGACKSPRGSKPPFGSKQSPRSAFTTHHNVDVLSPQEDHLSMPCTTVDAHVGFVKQPQQPALEASRARDLVQAASKTQQKKGWFKKRWKFKQPPFPDFTSGWSAHRHDT